MINKHVKFKILSDKTQETEQIISDYFTGRLDFLIKKFKKREYNTLQAAKASPVKVKTSKIADTPGEQLLKNEEKAARYKKILTESIDKKIFMESLIESEFITEKEQKLLKKIYAEGIDVKKAGLSLGYRSYYKAQKARKRVVTEIDEVRKM